MTGITGVFRNGKIELTSAPDWPEGCPVVIEPVAVGGQVGMRDEDWPMTPKGLAALVERWDAHEPLTMTPAEE